MSAAAALVEEIAREGLAELHTPWAARSTPPSCGRSRASRGSRPAHRRPRRRASSPRHHSSLHERRRRLHHCHGRAGDDGTHVRAELELLVRIRALDDDGARGVNDRGHEAVRRTLRHAGSEMTLAERCAMTRGLEFAWLSEIMRSAPKGPAREWCHYPKGQLPKIDPTVNGHRCKGLPRSRHAHRRQGPQIYAAAARGCAADHDRLL